MTEKFVKPLSFLGTIKEIIVFYFHVFKHIFPIVILAAIVQALVSALMPGNPTVGLAVSILASFVAMFFYAWILSHADSVLMNRSETITSSLGVAKKRFLPLIGVLVLYMVLVLILGLFAFGMQLLGGLLHIEYVTVFLTICLLIAIFTFLAFTMPAVILDNSPAFKSFEISTKLVWGHWWRVLGIVLIFVVPVILLSLGVLLLPTRNNIVMTVYEFIFHIITYPLMVSLILVLYHDLKVRHQMASFKHIVERPETPHH